MPRNAATRSCSTILPVSLSSLAGETVPQNGQTSACLAGFQTASAPQAGQEYFCCAASSGAGAEEAGIGCIIERGRSADQIADHPPYTIGLALECDRLSRWTPLCEIRLKQ